MSLDTAAAITKLRSLTAKFDLGVSRGTPFYPTLCSDVNSDGADEEYGMLGGVPGVREWLGNRDFKDLRAAKWTITNKKWESSLEIDKDRIADDRMSLYGPILEQLGMEAAMHPDELLFALINAAESSDCFDGQYFFDTDHSWGDSGSQSNDLTATVASTSAPTVAETKAAFNAALSALGGFKTDQGRYLNPHIFDVNKSITILSNFALRQYLEDALSVRLQATGGDNVVLARPTIISSALYTSTTKFDVYLTDRPLRPFIFQRRQPLGRQMKGLDDREFKGVKFMADARYNVGYGAWWTAVRTTLST